MASKRTLLISAAVLAIANGQAQAQPLAATVQFFPLSGEVRIFNNNPTPLSFAFYSLSFPGVPALNGADGVWRSISDTYDASGNQFIDMDDEWVELATGPFELTEGEGVGTGGGTLGAYRAISLGKIWNPSLAPNPNAAEIEFFDADEVPINVIVRSALAGDYLADGEVDEFDYLLWKNTYGLTGANYAYYADGNLDGVINAADYTVWRDNLGKSIPGGGSGSIVLEAVAGVTSVVPEPASSLIALLAGCSVLLLGRRRARR